MSKRMRIMLICVAILFGAIFAWKQFTKFMLKYYLSHQSNIVTVSAMKAEYSEWQPKVTASGSVRAVRGVNVTTELAGMVQTIYFTPGATVKQGDLLVQLNAGTEIGQLQALKAQTALAQITYQRDKKQYAVQAISKQQLDSDLYNLNNLQGQTAAEEATVAKKTIRAPFAGRLGINNVNPGQYLNVGDKVTSLQTLDPIYVDFFLPQQTLAQIKTDMPVEVTSDAFPKKIFQGTITTINPSVESDTRNVEVEATIGNPTYELTPGMFATVNIYMGTAQKYLTLPQTAIAFNPYGNIVFIVRETGKDKEGKTVLTAAEAFVKTGDTRGDQVAILQGIKEGDTIVTSGQLKLKNQTPVTINNSVVPDNNPAPNLTDDHQ